MKIPLLKFVLVLTSFISVALVYAQDTAKSHLQQGLLYERQGMFEEAQEEYKKAVSLDPAYSDGYFNLGLIYYRNQQWKEAADAFEQVLALNPNDAETHFNLAVADAALGKYQEAIQHYDRSQELNYPHGSPEFKALLEPYRYKQIDFKYQPLLDENKKEVVIKINGNSLTDSILMGDVIKSLEPLEGVSEKGIFEQINIEYLRREKPNIWFEEWTVKRQDAENAYLVKFIPSPDGGTDIIIEIK